MYIFVGCTDSRLCNRESLSYLLCMGVRDECERLYDVVGSIWLVKMHGDSSCTLSNQEGRKVEAHPHISKRTKV